MASSADHAMLIGKEDSQLLTVSSRCFGAYSAPRQRILSMTSLQIIGEVTNLANAAQHEQCTPAVVVRLDPELDMLLRMLTCGDQLRADLPVLFQNQLASLIVKCWTYLVWMHMIETDDAPVGEQIRDQILWSLMRAFEPSHTTHPLLSHDDNRHAKTKIKQSLKLTALLLCHHSLLVKFVTLGNISADALVSLTQQQLNIDTLRLLVDRADRVSSRITKRNIRSLLLESVEVDEQIVEQGTITLTSPVSAERAAHELLTLTQPSSSSSSSSPSPAPPTLPSPSAPLVGAADINDRAESISPDDGDSTSAKQHNTTISREGEKDASSTDEDKDSEEEGEAEDEAEEGSDNESAMSIDSTPRQTLKRAPTRKKKRSRRRAPSSTTSEVPQQAVHEQQLQRSVPLKPQPSALHRLSAATFRAPDDVRGCVDNDTVHDLFCRHHLAWRRGVVEELAMLSPSELGAIREQHTESPSSTVAELYLALARRWGQRIQFVAPLQMEEDVSMEHALAHVSLEPEPHDSGWLFYSHEGLHHLLSSQDTASTSAKDYDFNDPDIALCSADARKYWVFASNHDRDDAGGNSAHMLALYRVFSGDDQASFDSHSGVITPLPLELFLRFGCMLVVVVQTEGTVVYVPSARNNESAHVVTTISDRAAVSVAGNVLNPRHITRLIRQHEDEGPSETVRLEWARDFSGTGPEVAETEPYRIGSAASLLQVPTAATINDMYTFLCGATEDDARYQPEFYRQSWIPDLFSTSQACRILSETLDHNDSLPLLMLMEQLLDAGHRCTPEARAVLAALATKAASTALNKPTPSWHACAARLGCPGHVMDVSRFQPVHSIKRPPILLLVTAAHTTLAQEELLRHIHQGITQGAVVCNSFVPMGKLHSQPAKKRRTKDQQQQQRRTSASPSDGDASPYEFQKWPKLQSNGNDTLTVRWMQDSLREQGVVYLTDIVGDKERIAAASAAWNDKTETMVRQLVGEQTFSGFLLHHCSHRSPGVHSPSFYALFSPDGGRITSPHHNESHRVAAWHWLLRHPKPESSSMEVCNSNSMSAASSHVVPSSVSTCRASAESISLIHHAMTAKSKVIAGSDHLLDGIDADGVSRRRKSSARDLYPDSVSLAFGELTEDSSWKVLKALAMTSSSRLLDVGSAFGRFCVHAALASPPGVSVTGIEAGIKRAQLASQFIEELTDEHNTIMAPVRPHIKLIQGDILDHLPELFAHSHVFLFDVCFVPSTWQILAHLLSYLSGVTEQVVISCQPLHTCNADLVCGDPVSLTLSGGKQSFTAHVYSVSSRLKHRHAVEMFESPVHGLGVRAVRVIRAGQIIMRVLGEEIYGTTFAQKSDVAKQGMYPYLTRMHSLDKQGERAFLHALDVSRYINSHVNTPHTQNVTFKAVERELYVVAVREIGRGEELLSRYENWPTDGERPWLTDEDLVS